MTAWRAGVVALAVATLVACRPASRSAAPAIPEDGTAALADWQTLKFGLFVHVGLYSIPGGVWDGRRITTGYSEQIMAWAPIPRSRYEALATEFNPTRWSPNAVCDLARATGMRYVVLTAKHHDGFNLFDTRQTTFDVVDATPYGRDIVAELASACRQRGLRIGLYFSIIDWHYPGATEPEPYENSNPIPPQLEELVVAQLEELLTGYGEIAEIWFDMGKPTLEQSRRFAETVRRLQPRCMISGRVWNHQGDFAVLSDNEVAESPIREPWESVESMFHETWGYRSWQVRDDLQGTISEKIRRLSRTVSLGGNFLLNIGPRGDGSLVEYEVDVLHGIGAWMETHGAAVRGTAPQPFFEPLGYGYATHRPGTIYLHIHEMPADGRLPLPGLRNAVRRAYWLVDPGGPDLRVEGAGEDRYVRLDAVSDSSPVPVVAVEYDGTLDVVPKMAPVDPDGVVRLTAATAYRRLDRNGFGYMDPPLLTGLTWDLRVPRSGVYDLLLDIGSETDEKTLRLDLDGRETLVDVQGSEVVDAGLIEIEADRPIRLSVAPADMRRGQALDVDVQAIRMVPRGS